MTVEFDKAPLVGGINLNSSYTIPDFQDFGVTSKSKPKKFPISKREGLDEAKDNMSARYSDDYDSYDDDFESANPDRRNSSRCSRARSPENAPKKSSRKDVNRSRTRSRRDSFASYRSAYGTVNYSRGPPKRGNKSPYSATSKTTHKSHRDSKMIHRVLSASRNRVARLHNIVEELQQESNELKKDNRTLKRVNQRQERDLKKVEGEEAELPVLLERHSAEMRSLQERLRRNQDILHKKERNSQQQDSEILKLRDKVKQLKSLSENKRLGERAVLAVQLQKVETNIVEKDKKITDLEKALTLKEKAKQRELKEQRDRYKKANNDLQRLQQDFEGLRMRLQKKEKELDEKNIYHHHIGQKKKRGQVLALPMAAPSAPREGKSVEKEPMRPNVFLTNASYDTASQVSEASPREADVGSEKLVTSVLKESALEEEDFETERREKEELEINVRRRREEDERKKKEDEERKKAEDRRRKEEKQEKQEREKKLREEEEERVRKKKDNEERKRLQEEEETRRKKDLLLARMRAIDNTAGQGAKPSEDIFAAPKETKPTKLPVFLQSSKPQQSSETSHKKADDPVIIPDNASDKKSSAGSGRSRQNYEFKQTVENLHHGLPAHASDEQKRLVGIKTGRESGSEEDLSFGGYKPSLGRRGQKVGKSDAGKNDEFVFGGYAPSVGGEGKNELARSNSGLNFSEGKKPGKPAEDNVSFVSYNPTFGGTRPGRNSGLGNSDEDPFSAGAPRKPLNRRRSRGDTSTFGGDLFGVSDPPKPARPSLFGDDIFKTPKDNNKEKNYSWENHVDLAKSSNNGSDSSLLPRRKRMQLSTAPRQNVRAVGNALDDVDDEIEEVIL